MLWNEEAGGEGGVVDGDGAAEVLEESGAVTPVLIRVWIGDKLDMDTVEGGMLEADGNDRFFDVVVLCIVKGPEIEVADVLDVDIKPQVTGSALLIPEMLNRPLLKPVLYPDGDM